MKLVLTYIGAVSACLLRASAQAQQSDPTAASRQVMTREILRTCVAQTRGQVANPEPACACTAGWLSARLNYRDFYLVGRFYHYANNEAGMQAEIQRLLAQTDYTAQDIQRVARFLQDSNAQMTAACQALER